MGEISYFRAVLIYAKKSWDLFRFRIFLTKFGQQQQEHAKNKILIQFKIRSGLKIRSAPKSIKRRKILIYKIVFAGVAKYYGVHLRSLSRSRRFITFVVSIFLFIILILYIYSPKTRKIGNYSAELENCINSKLERLKNLINSQNVVVSEWPNIEKEKLISDSDSSKSSSLEEHLYDNDEKLFLPYTGNGYIGLSIISKQGLYANHQKTLSLSLNYSPLAQIYSDNLSKKEVTIIEFLPGLVGKIQCYQSNKECIEVSSTVFAHRTRPSILIEEITLNNPTKESVTFDIIQMGAKNWNLTSTKIENFNNMEFTITKGIIDVVIDNKLKHLCISVGSTKLESTIKLKEHEFNIKYYLITVVKYSSTFLSGKIENLEPVLGNLENQVINELKEATSLGFKKLKREHMQAWNEIWKSGFGISNSLATGALNGDQINASLYYVLSNMRAPSIELTQVQTKNSSLITEWKIEYHTERCYEGFSTLHAVKLWKLPLNEFEINNLTSIWLLTLQKHGCKSLIELGAIGVIQALLLSIGGFKFTNHHLDLNLNPRQLHRDYYFRNINYANMSLLSVEVIVDSDNHAKLYVTLNSLIDPNQKFYACDAGCIDTPVKLELYERTEFPVKLTNPPTSILYVSSDKNHIDELKHTLHVQEVDIAPQQDANSIAIHKHGHSLAGLATLFWTIFVILIIIFHLFLFKLIYRELCGSINSSDNKSSNYSGNNEYIKKHRYARTV